MPLCPKKGVGLWSRSDPGKFLKKNDGKYAKNIFASLSKRKEKKGKNEEDYFEVFVLHANARNINRILWLYYVVFYAQEYVPLFNI